MVELDGIGLNVGVVGAGLIVKPDASGDAGLSVGLDSSDGS